MIPSSRAANRVGLWRPYDSRNRCAFRAMGTPKSAALGLALLAASNTRGWFLPDLTPQFPAVPLRSSNHSLPGVLGGWGDATRNAQGQSELSQWRSGVAQSFADETESVIRV